MLSRFGCHFTVPNTTATRLPQPDSNDAKSNLRSDKGSVVDGKLELILRANKNAADAGMKAAAAEDSYKIWAKILIDPENLDENQAAEDLSYILHKTDWNS